MHAVAVGDGIEIVRHQAWRNENASGPVTSTSPRSERSTTRRSRARSCELVDCSHRVPRVSRRGPSGARPRGRRGCREQRPRLVAAFQVLVGRRPSRRRSRPRPARSPGRRARPSCGSRWRCRGCRRSRRSRRRPAYGPRLVGSSSSMISIARTLGAPLTVPAGNVARSTSTAVVPAREVAGDLAGEVHHVRVALERHQLLDLLGAELHDPADVVAGEVDEHHVLGPLLRVLDELGGQAPVVLLGAAAAAGARDRAADHPAVEQLHHRLGRRADERRLGMAQEVHVRRRVHRPQHAVHVERVDRPSRSKRCASTTWKMSPARMCSARPRPRRRYIALGHGRRAPRAARRARRPAAATGTYGSGRASSSTRASSRARAAS